MTQDMQGTLTHRKHIARWALYGSAPLAAIAVAYFATRGAGESTATNEHANHGAEPAAATAQPVMLSAENAQRIGVVETADRQIACGAKRLIQARRHPGVLGMHVLAQRCELLVACRLVRDRHRLRHARRRGVRRGG